MTEIGYYLYENVPLQEKFGWIAAARGSAAVDQTRVMLGNTGNVYSDSDTELRRLLTTLRLDWQGSAAAAASQALHGAADRSGRVGTAGGGGSGSVHGYGDSFDEMRKKVHWDDPGQWDWFDAGVDVAGHGIRNSTFGLIDIQSDYASKVEHNRNLDADATAALYTHETQSRAALAAFPAIGPASALTQGVPGGGLPPIPSAGVTGAHPDLGATRFVPPPTPQFAAPTPDLAVPPATAGVPGGRLPAPGSVGPGVPRPGNRLSPSTPRPGGTDGRVPPPVPITPGNRAVPGTRAPGGIPRRPTDVPGQIPALPGSGPGDKSTSRPGVPAPGSTSPWRAPGAVPQPGGVPGRWSGSTGSEFGNKLPAGNPEPSGGRGPTAGSPVQASRAAGHSGVPFIGGMGAGSGAGPTERKTRYWIPSSEPFDVPLPPHTPAVIEGGDE